MSEDQVHRCPMCGVSGDDLIIPQISGAPGGEECAGKPELLTLVGELAWECIACGHEW